MYDFFWAMLRLISYCIFAPQTWLAQFGVYMSFAGQCPTWWWWSWHIIHMGWGEVESEWDFSQARGNAQARVLLPHSFCSFGSFCSFPSFCFPRRHGPFLLPLCLPLGHRLRRPLLGLWLGRGDGLRLHRLRLGLHLPLRWHLRLNLLGLHPLLLLGLCPLGLCPLLLLGMRPLLRLRHC